MDTKRRYCRFCKALHPYNQDGCERWPAVLPPKYSNQVIINLGVGRRPTKGDRRVFAVGRGEL